MGNSKIKIIIAREFSTRVKKKSFIFTTILAPIFFAAIMVVPSLIAMYGGGGEEVKNIGVVDASGVIAQQLKNTEEIVFVPVNEDVKADNAKDKLDDLGVYALVFVSELDSLNNVQITTHSTKQLNMSLKNKIRSQVEDVVEQIKLESYAIPELDKIVRDLRAKVPVTTYQVDEQGQEKNTMAEISMAVGYISSFMIYMFIFMFGGMVMRSVIEEKTTRIIEVIVSSIRPFELMIGKILGVASVALTQFFIWIVLTVLLATAGTALIGMDGIMAGANSQTEVMSQMTGVDVSAEAIKAASPVAQNGFTKIVSALANVNYVLIIGCFILFFAGGYLLYSSLFAAIGASVDNEADTQQLMLPVTAPLIIGLFIMMHTFQHPDSSLSFWGSMIPFTSPMVMMARIGYGVPTWEIVLSLSLLFLTFLGAAYVSGKIYRIGILMYGKKVSWKEIYKWMKM